MVISTENEIRMLIPGYYQQQHQKLQLYMQAKNLMDSIATPRHLHDKLMMLGEDALRALLTDIIQEVRRRCPSIAASDKAELDFAGNVEEQDGEEEEQVETGTVRAKSRNNMAQLDDGIFGELVCDIYAELCRRFPSLQPFSTNGGDVWTDEMSSTMDDMSNDSLGSLERLLAQLYTITSVGPGSTPANKSGANSCKDTFSPLLDISEANERVRILEQAVQAKQVQITELEVSNKNLKFMRDDFAQKCSTYEHLLMTVQAKLDAVHLEHLELVEARKDQDVMMATLGTKICGLEVLLKEVEVSLKKAKDVSVPCTFQDLEGFGTPFGPMKKYHSLNDALNLCDVLIQAAYGLNPIELLETLKLFINTTHSLSNALEAQEMAFLQKDPSSKQSFNESTEQQPSHFSADRQAALQAAIEASQALRNQFAYLLRALLTAAKHLALNRRNLTEISTFENLVREAYVVLVKMGFQRTAFHLKYVTVHGEFQALQNNLTSSFISSLSSSEALVAPNTLVSEVSLLKDALIQGDLSDKVQTTSSNDILDGTSQDIEDEAVKRDLQTLQTTGHPHSIQTAKSSEALEEAREALQKSTNALIHQIQKALLALKVSPDIISADIISLTQQISQSASSLAQVGAVYVALLTPSYKASKESMHECFTMLRRHAYTLSQFRTIAPCKSPLATRIYDIAKTTKELLTLLSDSSIQ